MPHNEDFIDRFTTAERAVRTLELRQRPYFETVIVGGEFDSSTEIPPFFTPFGGEIVVVYYQTLNGEADIECYTQSDVSPFVSFTVDPTAASTDLEIPKGLAEGDRVYTVIADDDGSCTGLSVGYVIEL